MAKIFQNIYRVSEQNMSVVDTSRKKKKKIIKEAIKMSKNKIMVPEAKQAMENFKMEAAREVGVDL